MSQYLILAETVLYKNGRLTCINVYDRFTSVALPAEFQFDMAIMCGPNWNVGDHKLEIKAKSDQGNEVEVGTLVINIPNEDFVYNAYAQNLKVLLDYSVKELTFIVFDNGIEIISRKYPVLPVLVPQNSEVQKTENNN